MEKFKKLGINEKLIKIIEELKFSEPSEIQEKSIPLILQGKDIIGQSATGSGKTLAFGTGVVEGSKRGEGLQSLILTPTRELAEQISKNLKKMAKHFDLRIQEVYGGVSIRMQEENLPRAEVVVGTPGRILDHIRRKTIDLSKIKILVLDEADRMLEMGFIDDVVRIIEKCPEKRQTMLFSATISNEIEKIGSRYMNHPVFIEVETYVDSSKLHQFFYDVPPHLKFSLLVNLLQREEGFVMVFCGTRRNVDLVTKNLKRHKIQALAIHGGLSQSRRNQIMESFHSHDALILVCTDVAARGLDIKDVSHVYNYDIPATSTDYIHRIGRTARAGTKGIAISLVSKRDYDNFRNVREDDSLKIEKKDLPEINQLEADFRVEEGFGRENRGGSRFGSRSGGGNRSSSRNSGGNRSSSRSSGGNRSSSRFGSRPNSSSRSNNSGNEPRSRARNSSRDNFKSGSRNNSRSSSRSNTGSNKRYSNNQR
jgi:superfamily II DNA/RNA helicase